MEMNTPRLMSAFLLTGLLAAPALAFEVKPGEWTQEISNGKATWQEKICISPEQARKLFQVSAQAVGQGATKGCKTNTSQSGNVVSFETKCDWGMKIEGTMKSIGANEAHLEMTRVSTMLDGKPPVTTTIKVVVKKISDTEIVHNFNSTETGSTTMHYKYLGPTCGKDAEPFKQ